MNIRNFKINWRYATGEFLIVVIGIITAFQLNAWKEFQKDSNLLEDYLIDLDVGLRSDSMFYVSATNYFQNMISEMDSTENYLKSGVLDLPTSGQKSLRNLSDWYRIYVSNTAFKDLNNSGRLNLIQNKALRYDLIAYYQYIDFVKLLDTEYNQSLSRMKEVLLERLEFHNEGKINIRKEDMFLVLNYINQKRTYLRTYLSHREICQNINIGIRKQIAIELEK